MAIETKQELEEELHALYLIEERLLRQQLYSENLFELCKLMGFNDLGKSHEKLCSEMARTRNLYRRRLFLFFRGYFKTSLITQADTVQEIIRNPNIRILIASSTLENAKMSLRVVKNTFWTNSEFRAVYPDYCPPEDQKEFGTQLSFTVPNMKRIGREGTVECAGVGQTLTGRHYDLIKISDIVTDKNVNTKATMRKTADWVAYALSLLNNPAKDRVDVEGTTYDFSDFHAEWLAKSKKNKDEYFVMRGPIETKGVPLFPERFSLEDARKIEQDQGSAIYCNPYESPILMSDWSYKPIGEIKPGDEIIGFAPNSINNNCKLIKSKVIKTHNRIALVQKMTMESGLEIRCTPDHLWYSGRKDISHKQYYEAKVGRILQRCINTKEKTSNINEIKAWNYLAGMIDGDGGCKHYGVFITQCKHANLSVYNKIKQTLDYLKIEYTEQEFDRIEKKERLEAMGFKRESYIQNVFYLKGGRQIKYDLLNNCDFAKKEQVLKGLWERTGSFFSEDRVVSIVPDKFETVFGLTTETGNYIVWGCASKNSGQYQLSPINAGTAIFKKEHIKYMDRISLPRIVPSRELMYPRYMTIDLAVSEESHADYSVMTVSMFDYDNVELVLDMQYGHWGTKEIGERLMKLYKLYQPEKIGIEAVASQKLMFYILDEMYRSEKVILPLVEIKRDTRRSKAMRIKALQPRFEQHKIRFCDDLDKVFIENQLLRYDPDKKANSDDFLDTLADMEIIKSTPEREVESPYIKFPHRRYIDWLEMTKDERGEENFCINEEDQQENEYYAHSVN